MTIDEVLTKQLKTICTRTYPVNAFKDAKPPYIVYDNPWVVETKALDGYMDNQKSDIDIYIVCETYTELKQKVAQVVEVIKNMEQQEVDGIYFDEIVFTEDTDQSYDTASKTYFHVLNPIFYY